MHHLPLAASTPLVIIAIPGSLVSIWVPTSHFPSQKCLRINPSAEIPRVVNTSCQFYLVNPSWSSVFLTLPPQTNHTSTPCPLAQQCHKFQRKPAVPLKKKKKKSTHPFSLVPSCFSSRPVNSKYPDLSSTTEKRPHHCINSRLKNPSITSHTNSKHHPVSLGLFNTFPPATPIS